MTPTIDGKYQLLRRLGKGGMAEVFLAKQVGLDGFEKLVVIKRILPGLAESEDFVTMFLDEARTAADLRHPNVVNIFEIGEDAGTYHMVMEFLHGQDIRKIQRQSVRTKVPIPLNHALQIVLDAANGLYHAHTKKDLAGNKLSIIHRDISPQNIITTYDGATKIVDFGIAKAASQNTETQTGVVKGKYTYMAPEQAAGEVLDHRTDQFALGIVLWELVTMRRLFKRENEIMTLAAITAGDVPRPSEFVEIPAALDNIIMKVLARNREDRFPDCQAMMLAIEDFLAASRMPHSPARLGAFMKELFADVISEEADLGVGQLDGASITGLSLVDRTAVGGRRGRSKSSANHSLSAAVRGGAQAGEAGLPTVISASHPALRSDGTEDLETPATTPRGQAGLMVDGDKSRAPLLIALAAALSVLVIGALVLFGTMTGSETGEIVVKTDPKGASVMVDGVLQLEKTPMVLKGVPVGEALTVVVTKKGFESFSFSARVPSADAQTNLETTLEAAPAGSENGELPDTPEETTGTTVAADDAEKPAETPPPDASRKGATGKGATSATAAGAGAASKTTASKTASKSTGKTTKRDTRRSSKKDTRPGLLTIVVQPWAKVYVDGEYTDTTPFPALTLPPGKHTVKLLNNEKGKSVTKKITIRSGKTSRIKLDWR